MPNLEELIEERKSKVDEIKDLGLDPYSLPSQDPASIEEILDNFSEKEGDEFYITGRVVGKRTHGAISFFDLREGDNSIQLFFKEDNLSDYNKLVDVIDVGDIIAVEGEAFVSSSDEKSIRVEGLEFLSKALRPLPEKWHGLKDKEERFRKRYLDFLTNSESRQVLEKRDKLLETIRKSLRDKGFIETQTPILQKKYGGALAKPFKTHLEALDMDLYLRIAPELYLKRLLVGGFNKIFEIGPNFRNEGIDKEHNPEFQMLEFYWAYQRWQEVMDWSKDWLPELVKKVTGKKEVEWNDETINFEKKNIDTIQFGEAFKEYLDLDIEDKSKNKLESFAKKKDVKVEDHWSRATILDQIYKKLIRPDFVQPTFITKPPIDMAPLARKTKEDDGKAALFQLVVGGAEIINAYQELNKPEEQKKRFEEQKKAKEKGEEEAHTYDKDYIEAMEHGMPPAVGFGLGIDRFLMFLAENDNLREVITFPFMKPKKED